MKLIYESKPGELQHDMFTKLMPKKYIEKIMMPNGKYRYFYTQDELDAYYAEQKKTRDANHQKTRSNTPANQANRDALARKRAHEASQAQLERQADAAKRKRAHEASQAQLERQADAAKRKRAFEDRQEYAKQNTVKTKKKKKKKNAKTFLQRFFES